MSDGHAGDRSLKDHQTKHIDANQHLQEEVSGRLWQLALIGEGLYGGGIAEAKKAIKDKHLSADNFGAIGSSLVGSAALGAVMRSKQAALQWTFGALGLVGGAIYTGFKCQEYGQNKQFVKALDAVYQHRDAKTFNKQTKIAEKTLGHEGFNGMLAMASSPVGLVAGWKLGPGLTRKFSPSTADWMYGKQRVDKVVVGGKSGISATAFNRDLESFVNKVSHGDVHVARVNERTKSYIFDKDNRISNIFIQKGCSTQEIEKQIMVASLADRLGKDTKALEVAMLGGEKAKYHTPLEGDAKRVLSEGVEFAESHVGQLRKLHGAQRYAIEGSEAYLRQKPGNDYTQFLQKVHGEWSSKRHSEAQSLVKGITIDDVTDAATHLVACEHLAKVAMRQTDYNRAAAKNSYIGKLDVAEKQDTIRVVSYYLQGHPSISKLAAPERLAGLDNLSRNLTPLQIELISKRVPDFDPQYFPHHLFEGQILSSVDELVSSGLMRDAAKTHRILCRLAGQANLPENIEAAQLLIHCARNSGMSEEQLTRKGIVEAGAKVLKEIMSTKQKHLISDLAIALKHLEGATRYHDAYAVKTMRELGYRVEEITPELMAKYSGGFRP